MSAVRGLVACSIVCLSVCLVGCKQAVLVAVLDGSTYSSDGSANSPQCPAADPIPGSCSTEGLVCTYATDCGLYAKCSGGQWTALPHACGQLPDGGLADTCTSHGGTCAPASTCPGSSSYSQYSCGGDTVCCPPPADLGPPRTCGVTTCNASEICVVICDCCGVPTPDGGPQPFGHSVCVPNQGQCITTGPFTYEGRSCLCTGTLEANCPCA
jgi:hypothetical protein